MLAARFLLRLRAYSQDTHLRFSSATRSEEAVARETQASLTFAAPATTLADEFGDDPLGVAVRAAGDADGPAVAQFLGEMRRGLGEGEDGGAGKDVPADVEERENGCGSQTEEP